MRAHRLLERLFLLFVVSNSFLYLLPDFIVVIDLLLSLLPLRIDLSLDFLHFEVEFRGQLLALLLLLHHHVLML